MKYWTAFLLLPGLMAFQTPQLDQDAEARAQALMEEIRCVACENEPISQSNAEIAADMRTRVRIMLAEGASDGEVRAWFSDRYGEFVLFRPSGSGLSGLMLWGLPFGLLVVGGLGLGLMRRQPARTEEIIPVAPDAFDHEKENES